MTKEVEEKAGQLVEEVEEPLRQRKEEAVKEARKAERQEDEDSESVSFWSSSVVGGEMIDNYRGEQVKFYLSSELPDGTDSFKIRMPDTDSVTDSSHELNRLLSLHDVDVDRIGDMNNERIPLIPVGSYDDPEGMDYKVDYPPVPTLPNKVLYRSRRLAMRLRLIKYRTTPRIRTDMFGDVKEVNYDEHGGVPAMSSSAYPYFRLMDLGERSHGFVPSELGVGVLFMTQWLLPSAVVFALAGGSVLTFLFSMLFLMVAMLANAPFVENSVSSARKYIKKRFFPSP